MRTNAAESRGAAKVLGRFHCQEALESAAPFVSYRARTQGLAGFERVFALKTLPASAQPTRPDATQRLLEIASRATSVRDPRIGQVVDSGTAPDGTAYVATEFLFGANLGALRGGLVGEANAEKSVPTLLLAHVAAEMAAALAAAHELSPALVHAGLTPNNVFVTIRGAVKMIDFGHRVAVLPGRLAGGKRFLSAYAAPELLLAGEGSVEADVFALASVLFELATGKTPPSARNPRSATDLSRALSVLPPDLAEALVSLLRADPAKRPTAREAERVFRMAASALSETELRAHLGALARRLSLPPAAVSSQDSAVMPQLAPEPSLPPVAARRPSPSASVMPTNKAPIKPAAPKPAAPPPPVVLAPGSTAPTKRERKASVAKAPPGRSSVPAAASPKPIEPQHTLPFSSLFDAQGGAAGATPEGLNHNGPTAEMRIVASDAGEVKLTPQGPATEASAMFELSVTDLEALGGEDSEPTVSGNSYDAVRARLTAALQNDEPPTPVLPQPDDLPVAGGAPAADRPNMSNLTTGELEAMFAPGLGDPLAPPAAPAQAETATDTSDDDFLDDAKTNAFDRRKIAHLLADADTPVRAPPPMAQVFPPESAPSVDASTQPLPWMQEEQSAPAGFRSGAREGTTEVDDAQLIDGDPEPNMAGVTQAAVYPHTPDVEDDDDLQLDERATTPRRRLVITLATAAVVALVAGVLGGMFVSQKPATSLPRADRQVARASAPVDNEGEPAVLAESVVSAAAAPGDPPAEPTEAAAPAPAPEVAQENPASPDAEGGLAPRDAKGRLLVNMQTNPPGAQIWINGGERGRTPATIELKERHRSLVLVMAGYQRAEETLDHSTLTAQRTWTLRPAKPPAAGDAHVSVECTKQGKYPIAIDGVETGWLCPAELALAPGEHDVSVYVPWRFKSYSSRVVVQAGQSKTVAFAK